MDRYREETTREFTRFNPVRAQQLRERLNVHQRQEGTGMGLAIVRHAVEPMDGTVGLNQMASMARAPGRAFRGSSPE